METIPILLMVSDVSPPQFNSQLSKLNNKTKGITYSIAYTTVNIFNGFTCLKWVLKRVDTSVLKQFECWRVVKNKDKLTYFRPIINIY